MVGGDDADLKVFRVRLIATRTYPAHALVRAINQNGQPALYCWRTGGLAEAYHFAECAGLDIKAVAKAIQGGAAQSWQMNNRSETIADGHYDFGFYIDPMRKDLGFALDVARSWVCT